MKRLLALSSAALVLFGLSACTSVSPADAKVRENLTPELSTLSETPREVDNTMIHAMDTNARGINNDLRRMWLLDRPTRLTRQPMPR